MTHNAYFYAASRGMLRGGHGGLAPNEVHNNIRRGHPDCSAPNSAGELTALPRLLAGGEGVAVPFAITPTPVLGLWRRSLALQYVCDCVSGSGSGSGGGSGSGSGSSSSSSSNSRLGVQVKLKSLENTCHT